MTSFDRRSIMKIAGAGLIGSAASAGGASAYQGTFQQLETAASTTEQYSDPQAALDDGFGLLGPYVPGMALL